MNGWVILRQIRAKNQRSKFIFDERCRHASLFSQGQCSGSTIASAWGAAAIAAAKTSVAAGTGGRTDAAGSGLADSTASSLFRRINLILCLVWLPGGFLFLWPVFSACPI